MAEPHSSLSAFKCDNREWVMSSLYKRIWNRKARKSADRFVRFRDNHSTSFSSTGQMCRCGHDHCSIDILDKGMQVIESNVCPFMYNVRNACLRARFGNHIPKIDSALLQEISKP